MKARVPAVLCILFAAAIGAGQARAAAVNTFVSASGADTNSGANCARSTPCRTVAMALSVTSAGGEVIALDSGDYGSASITQSVSVVAPAGVYAGLTTTSDRMPALSVRGYGLSVSLRGLTFRAGPGSGITGPSQGINAMGQVSIVVRDCDFGGLGNAVTLYGEPLSGSSTPGNIHAQIVDTVIHDGVAGINVIGGATVAVSQVRLLNLASVGVSVGDAQFGQAVVAVSHSEWAAPALSGGTAFLVSPMSAGSQLYVDHTVMTGGSYGVYVGSTAANQGYAPGFGYVTVTHSELSKIGTGLATATAGGGGAQITFSDCLLNANSAGVANASGGTLVSAGNNLFVGNGSDVAGSLGHASLQ
jgi:hypothetical protein